MTTTSFASNLCVAHMLRVYTRPSLFDVHLVFVGAAAASSAKYADEHDLSYGSMERELLLWPRLSSEHVEI